MSSVSPIADYQRSQQYPSHLDKPDKPAQQETSGQVRSVQFYGELALLESGSGADESDELG
jgi:hypothetical protein